MAVTASDGETLADVELNTIVETIDPGNDPMPKQIGKPTTVTNGNDPGNNLVPDNGQVQQVRGNDGVEAKGRQGYVGCVSMKPLLSRPMLGIP